MDVWINKLYKMFKKVYFIHVIKFILVIMGILAILYIIGLHIDDDNGRKINKEGFISSPGELDAQRTLLLDSIFERDKSDVLKTFKNQIVDLPVVNNKSSNTMEQSPCS